MAKAKELVLDSDEALEEACSQLKKENADYRDAVLAQWKTGSYRNQFATVADIDKHAIAILNNKTAILRKKREEYIKLADIRKQQLIIKNKELKAEIAKASKDTWYVQYKSMRCCLRQFQIDACEEAYKIIKSGGRSVLLRGSTGVGKTFVGGYLALRLFEEGWFADCKVPWKVFIVTKASVVEQFKRDLQYKFGCNMRNFVITNYEQLRTTFGETFIERTTEAQADGTQITRFTWTPFMNPKLIIWDECHSLKNLDSQTSRIAQAFNELEYARNTVQIFMSATPFTRINDMKCFGVACNMTLLDALARVGSEE